MKTLTHFSNSKAIFESALRDSDSTVSCIENHEKGMFQAKVEKRKVLQDN